MLWICYTEHTNSLSVSNVVLSGFSYCLLSFQCMVLEYSSLHLAIEQFAYMTCLAHSIINREQINNNTLVGFNISFCLTTAIHFTICLLDRAAVNMLIHTCLLDCVCRNWRM